MFPIEFAMLSEKMPAQVGSANNSLEQVVERIFRFRQISRLDQQLLMSAMLSKNSVQQSDHTLINRVFDALRQGKIRVVD